EDLVALTREALDDVHVLRVEEAATREPREVVEPDGIEHQRIAFPTADRGAHVRGLALLRIVLASVGRHDAVLALPAAAVGVLTIEEDDVVLVLDDAPRRAVPRNAERLARHDGVVFVRPHVELLDLVPVLGLVERAVRAEARRRLELEVERLVPRLAATGELLGRAATVAIAPVHAPGEPVTGEIGFARRRARGRVLRFELDLPVDARKN